MGLMEERTSVECGMEVEAARSWPTTAGSQV